MTDLKFRNRKEIGWEKQNGIIQPPSKINTNKQENVTN